MAWFELSRRETCRRRAVPGTIVSSSEESLKVDLGMRTNSLTNGVRTWRSACSRGRT